MNEIEVMSKIKKEKLDERNYFKTLIEAAYEEQMLTENDIENLQIQVLQLLDEKVYKYNGSDSSSIRKETLEAIKSVKWIPAWGEERITKMVEDRNDWCISRQRTWGVPIPIFYCSECGKEYVTDESLEKIQEIFQDILGKDNILYR